MKKYGVIAGLVIAALLIALALSIDVKTSLRKQIQHCRDERIADSTPSDTLLDGFPLNYQEHAVAIPKDARTYKTVIGDCKFDAWNNSCGIKPTSYPATHSDCSPVREITCSIAEVDNAVEISISLNGGDMSSLCPDGTCSCRFAWRNHVRRYELYWR